MNLLVVGSYAAGKRRMTSVSAAGAGMAVHCVQPDCSCLQRMVSLAAVGTAASCSHAVPGLAEVDSLLQVMALSQIAAAGSRDHDRPVAGNHGSCFACLNRFA